MNMCDAGAFETEADLISAFVDSVKQEDSPWDVRGVTTEFAHQTGRADVVVVVDDDTVLAFEGKLTDWRRALHQAYRNASFAHRSFVVLPVHAAKLAMRFEAEFISRGVGLCSMSNGTIELLCPASEDQPLRPWLERRAVAATLASGE